MRTLILITFALFLFTAPGAASTTTDANNDGLTFGKIRVHGNPIPFSNEKNFEDLKIKKCRRKISFSRLRKKIFQKKFRKCLFIPKLFRNFVAQSGITFGNQYLS